MSRDMRNPSGDLPAEHLDEDTQDLDLSQVPHGVRELDPLTKEELRPSIEPQCVYEPEKKSERRISFDWRWKVGILAVVFSAAVAGGFLLAGMAHDSSAERQAERERKQLEIVNYQKKIENEQEELRLQREELQREKAALQEQRDALKSQSDRLQGKNDQLESEKSNSKIGGFIDKVTGKEADRKRAQQENAEQGKALAAKADAIDQAIAEAQVTMDDVDEKLRLAVEMKREADLLREKAEAAYAENKDAIDAAVYYVKVGAEVVQEFLQK